MMVATTGKPLSQHFTSHNDSDCRSSQTGLIEEISKKPDEEFFCNVSFGFLANLFGIGIETDIPGSDP